MRVADIVEVAARLMLAVVDAPVCWRGFRPSLGLAVVGCWVHRGCLAVLSPVVVGAGVPEALRVLRGLALGFALLGVLVGSGLPPRRCGSTVSCGIVCAKALAVAAAARSTVSCGIVCAKAWAVAAAARSTVRRILGSSAAVAAAAAAACMAAAFALSAGFCVAGQWGSS